MNIFYLHTNPDLAARLHCDKHVVKMILESAQILCTILNEARGVPCAPYKSTHKNHPCTLWAAQSRTNALWLYSLAESLNNEFMFRFDHTTDHKSMTMLKEANVRGLIHYYIPDVPPAPPAQAMPDYLRTDDAVFSYRLYYKLEKQHILKYTKRLPPEWLE